MAQGGETARKFLPYSQMESDNPDGYVFLIGGRLQSIYKVLNFIRSSMVPLTMPLAMIAAIPIPLFTRSKRRAINFSTALWADMSCRLIGLSVQVTGEEHLQIPRPAVSIYRLRPRQ